MDHPFGSDFRWEDLSEQEKQELRAQMRARLTQPNSPSESSNNLGESSGVLSEQDYALRVYMASNPNTPAPVLHQLAGSKSIAILERVAENPRAHAATLTILADHEEPEVRAAVAENSNTPIDIVRKLSLDESPDVRYRLAENHYTVPEILQILQDDPNPYVACRAQKTLSRLQSYSLKPDESFTGQNRVRHGTG